MKLRSSDWLDIVIIAGIAVIVISLAAACDAGTVCKIQRVQRVQHHEALSYFPKVHYDIGANVRAEAVATHQFRQSDEYQELRDLRAFREGIEHAAIIAQGNSAAGSGSPPQPATGHPVAPEEGQTNPPADFPVPPTAPADLYPTLKETCAKCHSGESPKGDIWLDGSVSLDGPDAAVKRDAIIHAIRTGHMPPSLDDGQRLPPEKLDAIEDEIHGVSVVEK